jgi:hypothetical protein
MELLARASNRLISRWGYGVVTYWALNVILVGAEARWHLFARLASFDISELQTAVSLTGKLLHH